MATTREEKMAALREAGETVAHNIKNENLDKRYDEKFGSTVDKDEGEVNTGGEAPEPTPAAKEEKKTKRVIIHSNDRENEEPDMVVGLNGKLHRVKIGEEVDLDVELIGVINDALETKHVSVLDKKGEPTGEIVEKPRKRYIVEAV